MQYTATQKPITINIYAAAAVAFKVNLHPAAEDIFLPLFVSTMKKKKSIGGGGMQWTSP